MQDRIDEFVALGTDLNRIRVQIAEQAANKSGRVIDFETLPRLGNTGSVALPITMALGVERGRLEKNDRVAMLGIGSGINSLMLAVGTTTLAACIAMPLAWMANRFDFSGAVAPRKESNLKSAWRAFSSGP